MNLTKTRLKLLGFLAERSEYCVTSLADEIVPRRNGWSRQSAARWGAGYIRPLEDAGLIDVNRHVDSGVGRVRITKKGLLILEQCTQQK